MKYQVVLAAEAVEDLRRLRAGLRALVRDALDRYLRHEPTKRSRTRIKRLRGISRPQYRLRVGGLHVFYDVTQNTVEILAIVPKEDAARWLEKNRRSS